MRRLQSRPYLNPSEDRAPATWSFSALGQPAAGPALNVLRTAPIFTWTNPLDRVVRCHGEVLLLPGNACSGLPEEVIANRWQTRSRDTSRSRRRQAPRPVNLGSAGANTWRSSTAHFFALPAACPATAHSQKVGGMRLLGKSGISILQKLSRMRNDFAHGRWYRNQAEKEQFASDFPKAVSMLCDSRLVYAAISLELSTEAGDTVGSIDLGSRHDSDDADGGEETDAPAPAADAGGVGGTLQGVASHRPLARYPRPCPATQRQSTPSCPRHRRQLSLDVQSPKARRCHLGEAGKEQGGEPHANLQPSRHQDRVGQGAVQRRSRRRVAAACGFFLADGDDHQPPIARAAAVARPVGVRATTRSSSHRKCSDQICDRGLNRGLRACVRIDGGFVHPLAQRTDAAIALPRNLTSLDPAPIIR